MKKIALFIIFIAIALSYSCKKEDKTVSTTINGTLIVNGTNDPIKISKELRKPEVVLYHRYGGTFMGGPTWERVSVTKVDDNANFSFNLDLQSNEEYFLGYFDCDTTFYWSNLSSDWYNLDYFPVTPGQNNYIKLYVQAHSWVRPRFINSNPDPNNLDVFEYRGGIGSLVSHVMGPYLYGSMDTTFSNALFKTWSGTNRYGIPKGQKEYFPHEVHGKLTRNGVTRDTSIIYTVPAYDTSVVIIRY